MSNNGLGLLNKKHEAKEVHKELEHDGQDCVEVEDVWQRAFL